MKLAFLNIERFGARSNLQLDDLSQQLNVVYGPNGAGKTTIINFVRWVLYGNHDETSRRYRVPSTGQAGGSLRIVDGDQQVRIVTRRDDGSTGGHVSISHATGDFVDYEQARLTGVDLDEYAHIFSFGFDQPPAIERTVRLATERGFELTYDQNQIRRLQELDLQLAELQRSYQGMTESEESLPMLSTRREEIQREIKAFESQRLQRVTEIDAEANQLKESLARRRTQLVEVEAGLRRAEDKIELRRRQMEEASRETAKLREETIESGRREVSDIDNQIQQWHNVLQAIRERLEGLQARMSEWEPLAHSASVRDEADLKLFLRTLSYQIEDIEQDVSDLSLPDEFEDHVSTRDYMKSILGAALQTMRDDVQHLQGEVQRQKSAARYQDHARERQSLRRCESELTELIQELGKRRDSLLSGEVAKPQESAQWTDYIGDSVIRPWYEIRESNHVPSAGSTGSTPSHRRLTTDFVLETRLNHLIKRRDFLGTRVQSLQGEMNALERRLELLLESREQIEEHRRLESLRHELANVDDRIRRVEDRRQLRDRMDALYREIEQLKAAVGPSTIVRDASVFLQRMTGGAFRRIRINESHEVWIDDADSKPFRYGELSRGTRDQTYLSLCLALVGAYHQRGVALPLLLNDLFVNIDSDRARATAEVLEEFAARGHQMILFTRHEHVLQLFPNSQGRRFKLQQRGSDVETAPRHDALQLDRIPSRISESYPKTPPASRRDHTYDWVQQWDANRRARAEFADGENFSRTERLVAEDTPLKQVEGLDATFVSRLQEVDVDVVRSFLELDPERAEQLLAGTGITAPSVNYWQSIVTMQCYVGLSANDATLLVVCGVDDPQELSYIDVSELHRRIEQCLVTAEHRNRFGSISRYERSRLSRWIQAARQSRYRRNRAVMTRTTPQRISPPVVAPRSESSKPRSTRTRIVQPSVETPSREAPMRFFLELSDPIVDAPSIGPKTAERFQAVDVHTVADLLDKDPDQVAEQIGYRRITSKLIREWQLQTQLVCRIPNLRGHDAQILVACGITMPRQLASSLADELHDKVKRFIRTSEGKRIMRNGKRPDLAEVTAWIQWAESARELQSA
ncbi:MAG: DUF4332 domain-containing protein [Planctomycetaceae bacterium]|nr:DUF4332 domain-containing protein [Planctomycetaceae bacterium]